MKILIQDANARLQNFENWINAQEEANNALAVALGPHESIHSDALLAMVTDQIDVDHQ